MKTIQKLRLINLTICLLSGLSANMNAQTAVKSPTGNFQFVFMTDIHLTRDDRAPEGFAQAIDSVNALHPDFVITGGDLVMDVLGQGYNRADSLYNLYLSAIRRVKAPVYNTMGNHEMFGTHKESGVKPDHPEYGEKMFAKRIGKRYYAFEHKGWKFMILNSPEDTRKSSYIGLIDPEQMEWLKAELKKTDPETPVIISTHIPLITAYTQQYEGSTKPNDSANVVVNSKEVTDLFKGYNLKLVLQGHMHTVEDTYVNNVHYLTGGAVSAAWWSGPFLGYEEGFMLISVTGDRFDWRYVDYKWDAKKQ